MSVFILLRNESGGDVIRFSMAHITAYGRAKNDGERSWLALVDGETYYVRETPEQIDSLILSAMNCGQTPNDVTLRA